MPDRDIRALVEAILDYIEWIRSMEKHRGSPLRKGHTRVLMDFLIYAIRENITWKEMFIFNRLEGFFNASRYKNASGVLITFSEYLFSHGKIEEPLALPNTKSSLPDIYEQYLIYREKSLQIVPEHLINVRRVLSAFHEYLTKHKIDLAHIKVVQLDNFMAGFKVAKTTRKTYRYHLRGFLKYLYHDRKIIKKDLAPLLLGPPQFAQTKLPKFLRPQQVKKLFSSLKLTTQTEIRTYAMIHLIYSLGLRPIEVRNITLDDISFSKGELTLRERKGNNPITLPMPEQAIKAIAIYLDKSRPKTTSRHLFLNFKFPYKPIKAGIVIFYISKAMKEIGLPSTAFWLRHTYAQNLLQLGQSIYEVKEMMGHQNIQSSQRYLYINIELMRKVLFDEEL